MLYLNKDALQNMERFYRANLLSSMSGIKPAMLVGTKGTNGVANLALFQNIVHLGADPALVGLINRPVAATPHTLANIEASGWFTLNSVHTSFTDKAHQTSARYDALVSEFDAVGLMPLYETFCPAPFVAESKLRLALQLVEIVPIKHNSTFLIIGSVEHVMLPKMQLQKDGSVDLEELSLVASAGLDTYFSIHQLARFRYAKPDTDVQEILPVSEG